MANARLARITDLFVEGTELVLSEDDGTGSPTVLFIRKLNPFEEEECRLDGQVARSDKLLEMRDPENREMRIARATVEEDWGVDELVNALVNNKLSEQFVLAKADVDADEEWLPHLDFLNRGGVLINPDEDPEGAARWRKLNAEYLTAIQEKLKGRQSDYTDELHNNRSQEERVEMYFDMVKESQARAAFFRERRTTEIWYAVRDCYADRNEDGTWNHAGCKHPRLFEREDIRSQGADLLNTLSSAIDSQTITPAQAGNSDAPTSSSDSSERSSDPEETSAPSSQEETSPDATSL